MQQTGQGPGRKIMYFDQFQSGRFECLNTASRYSKNDSNKVISYQMAAFV